MLTTAECINERAGSASMVSLSSHEKPIKRALIERFDEIFRPRSICTLVEEFGIGNGSARLDLAAIGDDFLGIEIKADRDTLYRLPAQLEIYDQLVGHGYLVTTENHLAGARKILPPHWGIVLVEPQGYSALNFSICRVAQINGQRDALSIARLLWKDEAIFVLELIGCAGGMRSKPARAMHDRLASSLAVSALTLLVARLIKSRDHWGTRQFTPSRVIPRSAELHE